MNLKKGIGVISLVLILCLSMVGCGSNTTVEQKPTIEDFNNEIVVDTTNNEEK